MKPIQRRVLAAILVLMMCISMINVSVYAHEFEMYNSNSTAASEKIFFGENYEAVFTLSSYLDNSLEIKDVVHAKETGTWLLNPLERGKAYNIVVNVHEGGSGLGKTFPVEIGLRKQNGF